MKGLSRGCAGRRTESCFRVQVIKLLNYLIPTKVPLEHPLWLRILARLGTQAYPTIGLFRPSLPHLASFPFMIFPGHLQHHYRPCIGLLRLIRLPPWLSTRPKPPSSPQLRQIAPLCCTIFELLRLCPRLFSDLHPTRFLGIPWRLSTLL